MAKKVVFETVSLGSEPSVPEPGKLAEWAGAQRGKRADLVSFLLEEGLAPQEDAGVHQPCAGGLFYKDRWIESISGITGNDITEEMGIMPEYLADDALRIRAISSLCRVAVPAPHQFSLTDTYYGDEDEAMEALHSQYRALMRAMRDSGIVGHVVHCTRAVPEELEALAGKKVFFYFESLDTESIAEILEYQQVLAIRKDHIPLLEEAREEFAVNRVILVDPCRDDLLVLLKSFDKDCIQVGGYCASDEKKYWESLVDSSILSL